MNLVNFRDYFLKAFPGYFSFYLALSLTSSFCQLQFYQPSGFKPSVAPKIE